MLFTAAPIARPAGTSMPSIFTEAHLDEVLAGEAVDAHPDV
jgi:hypothetical protein